MLRQVCGKLLAIVMLSSIFSCWASAQEQKEILEKSNNWSVQISNKPDFANPIYVSLKKAGNHWEIDGIFALPPQIQRSQQLELFISTRDLQRWGNAYTDSVINCESFEIKEANFSSVCTSSLSEKRSAKSAALGMLFGGNGTQPIVYSKEKVTAAIQSIPPRQALEKLVAFEQGRSN
jgi:hypothetical protein